jgi:hypothetical protein
MPKKACADFFGRERACLHTDTLRDACTISALAAAEGARNLVDSD